jgi:hypothetical protein
MAMVAATTPSRQLARRLEVPEEPFAMDDDAGAAAEKDMVVADVASTSVPVNRAKDQHGRGRHAREEFNG